MSNTVEQLQNTIDELTKGLPIALEHAYMIGAQDAIKDGLSNPPEVLFMRSDLRITIEEEMNETA